MNCAIELPDETITMRNEYGNTAETFQECVGYKAKSAASNKWNPKRLSWKEAVALSKYLKGKRRRTDGERKRVSGTHEILMAAAEWARL